MSSPNTVVIPAQLSYLVIYNPSLGRSDEALPDQIVFYTSQSLLARRKKRGKGKAAVRDSETSEELNEQLRQVGLAQGLVNFAKDFSDGQAVSTVDTEKCRTIIHELEKGWWILASFDLTSISTTPAGAKPDATPSVEYSSRELGSADLLLQYIQRNHRLFLLHNGSSLQYLYSKNTRHDFCARLERFWTRAAWMWEPLLHGNPAAAVFDGLKMAAGGELGVGVGEEDRGSGEREVLEGLIYRTDGLLDLVVSKLGSNTQTELDPAGRSGSSNSPGALDGVVFSGIGELSRQSLRDLSCWMEELYEHGKEAYGVDDRMEARERRRKARSKVMIELVDQDKTGTAKQASGVAIVPPSLTLPARTIPEKEGTEGTKSNGKVLHYLTLGYGTSWLGKSSDGVDKEPSTPSIPLTPGPIPGYFLVGLRGDVEAGDSDEDTGNEAENEEKILSRSVYLSLKDSDSQLDGDIETQSSRPVRVVVYVQPPFYFLLLFKADTASLNSTFFYRSLHHQLGPLRKPLIQSTALAADSTTHATFLPALNGKINAQRPIYALLYDPNTLTTVSTLPNIPDPHPRGSQPIKDWSRIEALQVYQQILTTISATRVIKTDLERTTKTSRGWWVVWMRLPPSAMDRREGSSGFKEAVLVRRSSGRDDGAIRDSDSSSRWAIGNVGIGAKGMVEGIGVDVRGYVEGLLRYTR
jgi:hypothetical protein